MSFALKIKALPSTGTPQPLNKVANMQTPMVAQSQDIGAHYAPASLEIYCSILSRLPNLAASPDDDPMHSRNIFEGLNRVLEKTWRRERRPANQRTKLLSQGMMITAHENLTERYVSRGTITSAWLTVPGAGNRVPHEFHSGSTADDGNEHALFDSLTMPDPIDWYGRAAHLSFSLILNTCTLSGPQTRQTSGNVLDLPAMPFPQIICPCLLPQILNGETFNSTFRKN
ncbi:hypothetical protein MPH_07463 [Macrophomina phaseolina MS6]|uniref:Uncharacterized protein n=1 Tax=Macrophomina phaseolina (strain MS6) TaxID=1126212 RepID=K2SER2_MACPH|nr:hypothetical protein MPH_07463 [Macrophomina phaseolina MS6]